MNGVIKTLRPYDDGNGGFGFVKTDSGVEYWFRYSPNDQLSQGQAVTFDTRPSRKDSSKQDAYKVRPTGNTVSSPGGQHPAPQTPVSIETYYLPTDTSRHLFSRAGMEIQNVSLRIEKYVRVADKLKVTNVKEYTCVEKKLLKAANEHQRIAFSQSGSEIPPIIGTLGARMVVGLGSASVFETGIILHKPYGFPYIPGSSVKGALRHLIIREVFGGNENPVESDDAKAFDTAFGTQGNRGKLFFYDAYPKSISKLELDILNPHFALLPSGSPGYYQNDKVAPTDDHKPNPRMFYAVPAGTEFTFRVGGAADTVVGGKPIRDWLEMLLRYSGPGVKTAVGYGWMQTVADCLTSPH